MNTPSDTAEIERIAAFRGEFKANEQPGWYNGYAHLAGTTSISVIAILVAIAALDTVTAFEWFTVPLTFLYANLIEYFGHRGPMHHKIRGLGLIHTRHSRQHHRYFTDEHMSYDSSADFQAVLFPLILIVFYLGLFALPTAALLALIFSKNVALLFIAVAVAYFLNYELLHFAYHAGPDSWIARLPLLGRLRRLHQTHHRPELMTRYNFNITYPIGDFFFGTLYRH
ncbi:MAG: fatty acid hydroxylase family protein [Gammaproteobacteria bacterium]|nr:fatty acid hydroxylase family protein [Gammaproteobacteria bacterium]MDH3768583.1 fatty acid hydroxylase family protein [Gammaproteobacteria bacterium]